MQQVSGGYPHRHAAAGVVRENHRGGPTKHRYISVRESTGMLVTQRKGLSQQDGLSRYGVEENVFMYQLFMRGPAASAFSPSGRSQGEAGFARYQGESHMNPELHRREADHLRPHERLKIVLINRKTGYIGTAVKTFADIASMQHAADFVSRIAMYPPNAVNC